MATINDIDPQVKQFSDFVKQYGSTPRAGVGTTSITPPPPTPPAVSTFGAGATNPSLADAYKAIAGDPGFQTWKTGSDLTLGNAAAARAAALRALVTQYGDIGGLQDRYGDIDQATREAAKNNPFSSLSTLGRNYDQGVEAFKRGLSARGALQSGDLQYGLDQLDWNRGQSQYDLGNQFNSSVNQAINGYAGTEAQQQQDEANAIWQAAQSVSKWWTPPTDGSGSAGADGTAEQQFINALSGLNGAAGGGDPTASSSLAGVPNPGESDPAYAAWKLSQGTLQRQSDQAAGYDGIWYRDPTTGELYQGPSRGGMYAV